MKFELIEGQRKTSHYKQRDELRTRIVRAVEVGRRKPMAIAKEAGIGYNGLIDLLLEEKQAVHRRAFDEGFKAGRRGLFPVPPPPAKAA